MAYQFFFSYPSIFIDIYVQVSTLNEAVCRHLYKTCHRRYSFSGKTVSFVTQYEYFTLLFLVNEA